MYNPMLANILSTNRINQSHRLLHHPKTRKMSPACEARFGGRVKRILKLNQSLDSFQRFHVDFSKLSILANRVQ